MYRGYITINKNFYHYININVYLFKNFLICFLKDLKQ